MAGRASPANRFVRVLLKSAEIMSGKDVGKLRKTHYFYAVEIPRAQKELLHERAQEWRKVLSFKSWVHHDDYHITLAFLGNAPEKNLLRSRQLVREALAGKKSFPLVINHLGFFGRKEAPRVFWAGVEENEALFVLREAVYSACTEADFSLETRPFRPHLTLARTWTGNEKFSGEHLREQDSLREDPISFRVKKVILYQTRPEGIPRYQPVASFPLS